MPGSHGLSSNHAPRTPLSLFPFPSNHRQTVMNISLHLSLNPAFLPTTASLPNPPLQTHHPPPPPSKSPTPTHKTPLLSKQHPTHLSSPPPLSTNPHPLPHQLIYPLSQGQANPAYTNSSKQNTSSNVQHPCHRNSLYRQHGIAARPQKEEQVCSKRFFPDTAPTVPDGAGIDSEVARARSERDRGQRAYARSSPGRRFQTANYYYYYYDPFICAKEMEKSTLRRFYIGVGEDGSRTDGAEEVYWVRFFEGLRFFGYIWAAFG